MGKVCAVSWEELVEIAEAEVSATMEELPEEVRGALRDVPVIMERRPSVSDLEAGVEPDTLGYFEEDLAGVNRIRLWLENILDFAEGDDEVFAEEVCLTLLHEIGHVLGWDEEDLEERGLD